MTSSSLSSLFLCFLKIGCVSFGGFMSLVSMIETQVVEKRKWLSAEDMLDGVALASLLPGPMAVNTVAYVGYRLRGGLGALVSAVAVLLPTSLFMIILADLYFRFGSIPEVERIFLGILPAVAAIVLSVCLTMARKNINTARQWGAFVLAIVLLFLTPRDFKIYATFGMVLLYGLGGILIGRYADKKKDSIGPCTAAQLRQDESKTASSLGKWLGFLLLGCILILGILPLPVARDGLISLMTTFSSMSLTLFGGGYVFIPMIQDVVVDNYGWLTAREFIDGIALGQVTPGPILISASFIGQKVAGLPGALLSTAAIFAPPAILMVLLAGMLDKIKGSSLVQAALKGIRIAVIGLIFRAFLNIFMMAWPEGTAFNVQSLLVLTVFVLSFVALFKYKLDVVWIIPVAGLMGYLSGLL
jgi:chromate transporter